jgi:FkbM family methyltransferase
VTGKSSPREKHGFESEATALALAESEHRIGLEVARLTGKNAQRIIRELGERIAEANRPASVGSDIPPAQPSPGQGIAHSRHNFPASQANYALAPRPFPDAHQRSLRCSRAGEACMAKESDPLFMPGPSGTAREYFFKALFTNDQAKDADAMAHYIRPGSCVIDVGSNVGYFSRRFADKNPTGLVVAFEPQSVPRAIATVVSFFRRRRNIVVLPFALGAAPGLLDLKIPIKAKGRIGISLAHVGGNDDLNTRFDVVRELVPCETLDTILARLPTPEISLIKIDVEGGELQVLKGAVETLRRHRPRRRLRNRQHDRPFRRHHRRHSHLHGGSRLQALGPRETDPTRSGRRQPRYSLRAGVRPHALDAGQRRTCRAARG